MGVKRFLRRRIERALGRRGYSVVGTGQLAVLWQCAAMQRSLPEHLRRVLSGTGCDAVLDVGANSGQFRDLLRDEAGWAGPVVSYEPLPGLAAGLAERAQGDPRWRVVSAALGERAGTADFHVMAVDVFSSFLAPNPAQPETFRRSNAVEKTISVPVRTLADEVSRLRAEEGWRTFFLKLDTQGHDLQVLRGGGDAIASVVALLSEVSLVPIYEGMTDWLAALGEYRRLGFEVAALDPVSVDPATSRLVEADCLLVRAGTRLAADS